MRRLILLVAALLSLSVAAPAMAAEKPAAKAAEAAKVAPKKVESAAATAKQEVIDINTASEAELKAIPNIGDAYAKKIIAGRPYPKKDQLVSKKILPKGVYDKVKDKIVAKQMKK